MQKALDYTLEENRILHEVLRDKYDCKRLILNDSQKRRLGRKGKDVGRLMLKEISVIFCPDTILKWFATLVAQKYDGSSKRKGGRSRISKEWCLFGKSA